MINDDDISLSIIVVDPIHHNAPSAKGSDLGFFLLHREAKIQSTSLCVDQRGENAMSYKENGERRAPRLPQSPTKFSHGIVNIQTSSSNVRSNNVHSNRFTSNLSGRFSQTRLWMRPLTSASLRSGRKRKSKR